MCLRLTALVAAFLLLLGSWLSGACAAEPGLFGTSERFSSDLSRFTKWDSLLLRAAAPQADTPQVEWWRSFVLTLGSLPLRERIERANEVLNRVPYVTSVANWHDPDHWETPLEFVARGGQCEDYAIAKFMALEQSGVPQDALRLVIVHDTKTGADHAVTVVYVDGQPFVLDNQVSEVIPARPGRYLPYYSINRTGWWYHGAPPAMLRVAGAAAQSVAR